MSISVKEPVLRARVDEATKARFEEICHHFGETASDRLRQLVEDFVREHASALGRVDVRIERPADYDHGAWRVTAALKFPEQATWQGAPIAFAMPELKHRIFIIPDAEYRAAVLKPGSEQPVIGGRFSNGLWRADLYSNGLPEDENPTSIDVVKAELTAVIEHTLERFHGA
ncbi:hypothetical protein KEX41_29450 (plasmid) [Burkholderia thailandensis]|uniref:hypothetical protein n=1 Tax=Burkholderia thailandensis TaxID=57975 RepID=UPI00192E08E7|nr:hypothetical protein [Burkholderia thailandensis]MBS2132309.1 hypothetical protein [Burkholderia thailandensis]QRA15118.1 hypothetical protein JMY07_29875 [Burkholderia thailandensis]